MDTEAVITQNEDFFVEEIDGEWLLFKPDSQRAIYLDEAASIIWQLSDGSRNASSIAREIFIHYPGQEDEVREDVFSTLATLVGEGALALRPTD